MSSARSEAYTGRSPFADPLHSRRNKHVRFLIFLGVFVVSITTSLIYVFSRPPVFESVASVLITPPEAEKPATTITVEGVGRGTQDSAVIGIERYQLLATPLLDNLLHQLKQDVGAQSVMPDNLAELRAMISVEQFEDTNIVKLRAAGPVPEILPVVLDRWLTLYRETQAQSQQSLASDENAQLQAQVEELQRRISDKRSELAQFRLRYDIVSMQRDENQLVARLKGLTTSLNTAKEEEVKAQGRLDAARQALARGQPIVDLQDQRRMANLEQSLTALEQQIKEIEQRFTRRYMELDPKMMAILRQRDLIENQIAALRAEATASALASAEQNLASAHQSVTALAGEFEQSKQRIADFSERFAEHEALVNELAEIEAAHRQASDRLLRREVDADRSITKVNVVESASRPIKPIWPNYPRDAAIGLGGSLLLGLLVVLLFDFLNRPGSAAGRDINAIFINGELARAPNRPALEARVDLDGQLAPSPNRSAISYQAAIRELDEAEISMLMTTADEEVRLLVGLLLCGFSLDQIAPLRCSDIDLADGIVTKLSRPPRPVAVPPTIRDALQHHLETSAAPDDPIWRDSDGAPRSRDDLAALLTEAAHDAGLVEPELVTTEAILHSYRVYLVRQGMRLADLEPVTGPISPGARAAYSIYSPPGPAMPVDQIEIVHPALVNQ